MGNINNQLLKEEEIKYSASIHWAAFLPGIFWTLIALLATQFFAGGEFPYITIIFWAWAAYRFIKGLFYKTFTECILTNTRIIYKFGFISRQMIELQLNKCEGVSIDQGLLGRILNYGTVIVTTGGPTNRFHVIADPISFKNIINEQIDLVHSGNPNKKDASANPISIGNNTVQPQKSTAEEIKELSDLMKQGLITEEEFNTMKSKIINHN